MRVPDGPSQQTERPPAVAVGWDGLLATKLHVPRPRSGFLLRPRLLERLAEGAGRELVLVCTPAGFGKTTLLGDWARRSQQPVAWLSLEPGDNDPTRFWRYVVAALDGAGAGAGFGDLLAPLLGRQVASLEAVVTALLNGLAGLPDRRALVLDDYHVIDAPPVHQSLGFLLDRLPGQLQVVVASRADPPLPLARLRVRGQLVELREHDLRFTEDETAALLRETTGLDLPSSSLAALSTRTEGWVAGLQLAALLLQGRSDPAGFVASFSGSHRYVLDYLTEEVLARQPDQLVRFLLETSILGRLSGPLCDAVTGQGAARPPWSRSSGPTCSWFPWTRNDAGGATTACSPTCCAPVSSTQIPTVCRCCTATRPPGWRPTGRPMRPWIMPWLPGRPAGPPGWSSSTARSASSTARARPSIAGCRRCPPRWSRPGRG